MYEVFLNDRKIQIHSQGEITLNKPVQLCENLKTKNDVRKWFFKFIKNNRDVIINHPKPEIFFKTLFQQSFIQIPAAGGIVIRENKMLLIFRNEKWDLPKGKLDNGESVREAALREVEEECGISGHKITKQLPSTFHIFQSPFKKTEGKWIFKETFWFEMEYKGDKNGSPQTEENITDLKWVSKNKLDEIMGNTYANLKPLISLYRN